MDSLITAAARALAAGDPLGALKLVALRDDGITLFWKTDCSCRACPSQKPSFLRGIRFEPETALSGASADLSRRPDATLIAPLRQPTSAQEPSAFPPQHPPALASCRYRPEPCAVYPSLS
jgi:hypothetical protein